jgi:hypothetical protein
MKQGRSEVKKEEPGKRGKIGGRDEDSTDCGLEKRGKVDCETTMRKNTMNLFYCQDKYILYVYHWKSMS